jgi:ABC-2 type transport system permease protein
MLTAAKRQLKVILLSVKYNLMREMTNHVTFITNILFMILNNATFIIQWLILFQLKRNIGGYHLKDVMLLWGIAASSYGLSHIFFERAYALSDLITNGKLDSYLVQPKNVLLGVISSGTSTSAIGDLFYGYIILFLFRPGFISFILFTLFSITGGMILTAFAVIVGSLSFWMIKGDMVSNNMNGIMVHFSTYPDGIFKGVTRLILYTIIPVGMANYLPLKTILHFHVTDLLIVFGFTVFLIFTAFLLFYEGLRRYSSGNLMSAKL